MNLELETILNNVLPIVIIAISVSSLSVGSIEGFKDFFKLKEINGNYYRALNVIINACWVYIFVIHYGGGSWFEFGLTLFTCIMGATTIYNKLINKEL